MSTAVLSDGLGAVLGPAGIHTSDGAISNMHIHTTKDQQSVWMVSGLHRQQTDDTDRLAEEQT